MTFFAIGALRANLKILETALDLYFYDVTQESLAVWNDNIVRQAAVLPEILVQLCLECAYNDHFTFSLH